LIRVAVVASALALRLGLRELLQSLSDVEVTAEAATTQGLPPVDVLVITSPGFLDELGEEPPPVLLLSEEAEAVPLLAKLPIWGVLPLEASVEEISAALHALVEGLLVGAPGLVKQMYERPISPSVDGVDAALDPLTARERQVLQLAAEGLANKEIAVALQISEHTVKFHLSSLYSKLGVASRTEAVRAGTRRGWLVL
jgi:DNA-binding NarL/FixJ family response regulator